jgi:hypothetical protein
MKDKLPEVGILSIAGVNAATDRPMIAGRLRILAAQLWIGVTFDPITNTARKISTVGGSLRDVQMLAGHTNLRTTQRYIEANPEAQVRIVELV